MKLRLGKKEYHISPLAALGILAALALLISAGSITLAKYISVWNKTDAAIAKPFYFCSDKLGLENPYYQLTSTGEDTVQVSFTLQNYVDDLRCTPVDFACDYAVRDSDGVLLTAENAQGQVSFTANSAHSETVTLSVDASLLSGGKSITATATTTEESPYQKTISARFGFSMGAGQITGELTQEDNAVVLSIEGGAGESVTVNWPNSLAPDRTGSVLSAASGESVTFSAESGISYALAFLKTDPGKTYRASFAEETGVWTIEEVS